MCIARGGGGGARDACSSTLAAEPLKPLPRLHPLPRARADLDKQRVIAAATLFVERKFIRGCSRCGHIEDVVVDSTYRGLRLGKRVIEALVAAARELGCYKVILDCSEANVPFYEKCGLTRKEVQMVAYL